jgi:hypothetical protein
MTRLARFSGMTRAVVHNSLDLAATRRVLVQSALGAGRDARLAALIGKHLLAALAAENNVAVAVDGRGAAEDRAFVLPTLGAYRGARLARMLVIFLDVTALAAQCHFEFGLVIVRYPDLLLTTTGQCKQ